MPKPRIPRTSPPTRLDAHRRAKDARKDAGHLANVRTLPCAACDARPPSQAHHLLHAGDRPGMGRRSSDRWAIPLCSTCHDAAHAHGRPEDWLAHEAGVHGRELASSLYEQRGDVDAMERALNRHKAMARKRVRQAKEMGDD